MLVRFLADQRATLEMKCSGAEEELARRSVEPSTLSLLGLVRHLAEVERRWFRHVLAGQDVPALFCAEGNADGDFDFGTADSAPDAVAAAWAVWRGEVAFADRLVGEAPHLDSGGTTPGAERCRCAGC